VINTRELQNQVYGNVFSIERFTLHDGPGIRTTVFLKGCPLRCLWCSNPESHDVNAEIIYIKEKCTGCGRCIELCKQEAIIQETTQSQIKVAFDRCNNCGLCVSECYTDALTMTGEKLTAGYVYEMVARDLLFYRHSNGGVTLSGGEPLLQPEFSIEILRLCQENGIHSAIQTSGYAPTNLVENLLPYVDLFIYDIKHMNDTEHRRLTGVSNQKIIKNLNMLNSRNKTIIIQVALIPGLNDSEENLSAVFRLVKSLDSVKGLSLLSYHTLGVAKYQRMGKTYQLQDLAQASAEYLHDKEILAEEQGVPVIRFN
jgi:pyruvate formate lyase activating enzyme